jgi:hypothetical protein
MRKLAVLWLGSLVLVSMGTFAIAQSRLPESRILSGNDIGFRVEGIDPSGKPAGTLVIRINNEWVEVRQAMSVRPVK